MTLKADQGFKECLQEIELFAFDIDGTVTDSIEQIIVCFQRTFKYANLPVPTPEQIKGTIGMTLNKGIQALLPDPTDEHLALETTQLYRDTFSVSPDINVSILFDGIIETLDILKQKGYKLAMATGKARVGVDRLLNDCPELKRYFEIICTGDKCESKPSPAMINEISALSGVPVDKIMGVGDAILDIQMFRNAKCHELGVLTGVSDFYAMDDFDTEFILPKATDIIHYLD